MGIMNSNPLPSGNLVKSSDQQPMTQTTLFEPTYEYKEAKPDDYCLDMNEQLFKDYQQFLSSVRADKYDNPASSARSQTQARAQSQFLEWSKLLQKHFNQEKSSTSLNENKNKLAKIYKILLTLDERNWYEEMVSLYKEKQIMSKATGNMTGLTFDRKIIQLQEQFQWLVSAVANTRLNPNNIVGVFDFPPHRISTQRKRDRLDVSVYSNVRNPNSVTGSDEVSEIFSPIKIQPMQPGQISSARGQIGGYTYLEKPPNPKQNYYLDFPDIFSPAWQQGFLWKGVYFKLYSKLEAHNLKKELKALKHLGIEYLQTEVNFKMSDAAQSMAINPNESLESSRLLSNQTCTVLLPLICAVESSSWVLLGTPIFPVRSAASEENFPRAFTDGFKNSFLLSTLTNKNFKTYYKAEEGQGGSLVQTYTNLGQTTYRSSGTLTLNGSVFLLMNQVSNALISLPQVNVMMIINQDNTSNISLIEYQSEGLDPNTIKRALGYENQDIDSRNLLTTRTPKNSKINQDQKGLYFDVLKFKRQGWKMQMIYVTSQSTLPSNFIINQRALELLNYSNSKRTLEIKGNILLFGQLSNETSIVHPYFISEQVILSNFKEEGQTIPEIHNKENLLKMSSASTPLMFQPKARYTSQYFDLPSFVSKDSILRNDKALIEDKLIQDYFSLNILHSIESVIADLENSDTILNSASLRELFHRKGVNMRFEWIVYTKLKRENSKVLVGADIIARCIKQILNYETTKRLKSFKKQTEISQMDLSTQKRRMEEVIKDKSNLFSEDFYKQHLCQYINMLVKGSKETEYEANHLFFPDLSTELFLHRMKGLDVAKKSMTEQDLGFYLSSEIIKDIINIPCLHSSVFLNAISHHSKVSINYDVLRQVRNDKYVHWVSSHGLLVKQTDLNIIYSNDYYLTTAERCYVLLLKLLPNFEKTSSQSSIELILPSSLYKIRPSTIPAFDCFLHGYYELPDLEILNDWVILLESILNGLYTSDGQQNLLIEAYLIQMILAFFGEGDSDNQLTLSILERINTFANSSPIISPELIVAIHTWYGILSESKLFTECEQSYTVALLLLHKLYGDPRGRGGLGTPWELFITWRMSIVARLQGKIQDAEYSEELFDATLASLKDNPLSSILNSHHIYNNPLDAFNPSAATIDQQSGLPLKANLQDLHLGEHPFPHWIHNLKYDETSSKIDTIESTLQKTQQLLKWMIKYIPIAQSTGVLWDTAYLRDFFLSAMQSTFTNTMSMSSISNNSIDKFRDKSILGLDLSNAPKSIIFKDDRRDRKSSTITGNLIQMFEKDASTFNKKEINGTIYSWGQNNKGQVGNPFTKIQEPDAPKANKVKIYYPKRIATLKNAIILSVACGHSHSMAITLNGQLLAWGDNKYSQLGLGPNGPKEVYIPTLVPGLKDVLNVSCGHEHTIALTKTGLVYSWGEGEGGLLGHGDLLQQSSPKKIEAFNNIEIQAIVCGGLHTLALTKQGYVYAWGKGEGGQLGVSKDQLSSNSANNQLYLTTPRRVRSALEGAVVVQVACGDAHSLALTQRGLVYSWGYAYQGQLGLGISSESVDPEIPCQVNEPTLVEKLSKTRITDIYAGATFSLFLSDKKELYGCGLNESNQLGMERATIPKSIAQFDRMASAPTVSKAPENSFPSKLEFFTSMPVLKVACGEAHSLALVVCDSSYMVFSWGIQKQGQLGIGDIQIPSSTPRNISSLQYVMPYSMGCGAYHSLLVLGEPSKAFNKEALIERLEKRANNFWTSNYFVKKGSYELTIETVLNNVDNIIPSEEGRIDDPKAINKVAAQI